MKTRIYAAPVVKGLKRYVIYFFILNLILSSCGKVILSIINTLSTNVEKHFHSIGPIHVFGVYWDVFIDAFSDIIISDTHSDAEVLVEVFVHWCYFPIYLLDHWIYHKRRYVNIGIKVMFLQSYKKTWI